MLKVVHAMLVFLGSCSNDSDVSAIYLEIVAVAACILASTIVFYADFVGAEAGKAVVFVGIGAVCVRLASLIQEYHSNTTLEHHK